MPRPTITFVGDAARIEVPHDAAACAPRLRLGSARGGWLRLSWDDETLAYARHEPAWQGVVWARISNVAHAIIPPIRAETARQTPRAGWVAWLARTLFAETAAPLFPPGTYALAPTAGELSPFETLGAPMAALGMRHTHRAQRARRLLWLPRTSSDSNVFALRDPSPEDASRVKSWRKHARDGTLPPVLLSWISALDGYLVLDGHDRLHAAALEGIDAPLVSLHPVREHPHDPEVLAEVTRRYEAAFAHEQNLGPATRAKRNRDLVWASAPWIRSTSTARHEPELPQRFAHETRGLVLDDEIARVFSR